MLDDANIVKQRDPQGYLGFAADQPAQLKHDFGVAHTAPFKRPVKNVVLAGMGGSVLVGEMIPTWPMLDVPFAVCRDYFLPRYVDEDTLVVLSSYSGNTEETLSMLDDAVNRHAQLAIISDTGELSELARDHHDLYAEVPKSPQPRAAVFYMYRALVEVLIAAKLLPSAMLHELEAAVPHLEAAAKNMLPSVPESLNLAKQLAQDMAGKTPIIYGGPLMYPAAYKWKIDANENAKNTAWCGRYSEFNHNEFIGWSSHPIEKPFAVIDLISEFEAPRIRERFKLSDRMLSGMRPKAIEVEAKGDNTLEHLLYLVLLGDFATTYLAILNGVNPTPVALVEKFKQELGHNKAS